MVLRAFLGDGVMESAPVTHGVALLAEAGTIKAVVPLADIPASAERVKLDGLILAPGLVDLQVNGGGGVLFNDTLTADGVLKIAAAHRAVGTTAILPTLISDGTEKIKRAGEAVRDAQKKDSSILGIHYEGPFLNPEKKGVHQAEALRRDIGQAFGEFQHSAQKIMITLAPELIPADDIRMLATQGAVICAGHSNADKTALDAAKKAGLRGVTHLFNAMGPINAREPGLAGLALNDDDLFCGIICDGAHVAPEMMKLATRSKPPGKLFFVSDAMPPAGQHPPHDFMLYGKKILVKDGKCVTENGGLAGAALTLFECVKVAVNQMGIPLHNAIAMASLYPAQFFGVDKHYGSFAPGSRADFIAFDKNLNLQKVFAGGEAV
jgi:N-acetylglucosamine-6-phosphate deacetylase